MANDSENHLNLLAIFHYILGGLSALCGCIPLIHVTLGLLMLSGQFHPGHAAHGPEGTRAVGALFIVGGVIFMFLSWAFAALLLIAGRCLQLRKAYTFCFVVACLICIKVPLGTVLGVFTLIVLSRPAVKALFGRPVNPAT